MLAACLFLAGARVMSACSLVAAPTLTMPPRLRGVFMYTQAIVRQPVVLYRAEDTDKLFWTRGRRLRAVNSNADGFFDFGNLKPGKYILVIHYQARKGGWGPDANEITEPREYPAQVILDMTDTRADLYAVFSIGVGGSCASYQLVHFQDSHA